MTGQAAADAVILIPSLEPDQRLPAYIRNLAASGFGHILVVDDGSAESYQPIFREIEAMDRATVLHHDRNHGKGVALKTGYQYILDHYPDVSGVITADADGQHTVPDCLQLATMLEEGKKALYLGSRDFSSGNVPFKSSIGNRLTSICFRLMYGKWLRDTQTGLRAFRREELPMMIEVEGERFEYEMNVLIACTRHNIPMISIPIETIYENENKGSHYHPLKDSVRIFKVLLRGFFRFMGSSLLCFLVDQGLAALLRAVLPGLGAASGSFLNVNISGWGARLVSSVLNFNLNKNLVFRHKGKGARAAVKYAVLCVFIITLSNLGVWGLGQIGMAGWIAKILMDALLYFVSYQAQEQWVFREEK